MLLMICMSPLIQTCTTRKPLFHDLYGSYELYKSCQAIHGSYPFDSIGQGCTEYNDTKVFFFFKLD